MAREPFHRQLPLHLPLEAAKAREDIVVTSANRNVVSFLDAWPDWPGNVAIVAGPVGAGKSHLAHMWAARADAIFVSTSMSVEEVSALAQPVVVEDVRQGAFSESWLFHLFNAIRASDTSLLLTSRRWPGDWGIALPDLRSRMKLATLLELQEPDDELLEGVLMKLFADRQLRVDANVIDYLAVRMERSLAAAQDVVDTLDRLSLAERRAVTRPLAAQALRELGIAS